MGTLLLFLLALAPLTLADPATCRSGCHGSTQKVFKWEEGTTYVYKVEGKTVTSITNAKGAPATLNIGATAEVSVQPNCAHYLKLSGITVTGNDGKVHQSTPGVDAHAIRYNYHDGHIDSEICTADGDSNQGINTKRAIASLLQVAAQGTGLQSTTIHETDVFGTCPTEFYFSKIEEAVTVRKHRNLNLCANREHFISNVIAVPYRGDSALQNTPLQASTLDVTQIIKNGIIQSAESVESYLYRPLSNREAGAKTTITTKITLVSNKKAAPANSNVNTQSSIVFDPPHIRPTPGNAENILAAVNAARENMQTNVGPTSAHDFGGVVLVLRQSTKEDILKAYSQIHHKKMFQDALLATKTGDAIEAAVELYKKKELSPLQSRLWVLSLNVIRHATPGSLGAVASIVDSPESSRYAWLGAGALVGRYCREHECSTSVPELNALVGKLASPIAGGCKPKTKEAENKVILSLKALKNARYLGNNADAVVSCASDSSIPARVRVAALEAFLAESCSSKLRKTALAILKNIEEDSEIRIKAYLALVGCPNAELASAIKDLIENEPSNQVGGYIVSHLRNIRNSANPEKESARHYLGNYKPRKRFPNDIRKFSRNFEVSGLLDIINVGANAEANVIYSQRSFLPRSVSLNVTTDIFGQSVNIFEVGVRTENLDRVLEHYLGPKGVLKSTDAAERYSHLKNRWAQLTDKVKGRFSQAYRAKRSVSQAQIDDLSKKVNLGPDHSDAEMEVDLSLKLFGAEGAWRSYHGGRKIDSDAVVDKVFDKLDAGINKAKSFDHDIRSHAHFLDTEFIYPTGLGVPLKLATTGNSAIHVVLKGEIDIPAIAKNPENANVHLHLEPSATIELNGLILIDAGVVAAGIKVSSSLHTSTGTDIAMKTLDGQGVDINIGLPQAKSEIINLKSEVVNWQKARGEKSVSTPLAFPTKKREFQGCFDQLSSVTGLTWCADVSYPLERPSAGNPLFPLSGPAKLSVTVQKDDPTLTGYHVKAYYDRKTPNKSTLELIIETPNSKNDRRVSLVAEAQKSPEANIKVVLTSPWKKASLEGQVTNNDNGKLLFGKLTTDKKTYTVKVGLDVSGSPDARTYTPLLEYTAGSKKESSKDGKSPLQISGTITILKNADGRTYKFNALTLTTPAGSVSADGTLTRETDKLATDLKLAHDKHSVSLVSHLQRVGDGHYKAHVQAVPAQYPDFGFDLNYERIRQPGRCKVDLNVVHGPNLKSDTSKLTLSNDAKYKYESASNFEGSVNTKVAYPAFGVDVALDGAVSRNAISYNLQAAYDKKKLDSKLSAKTNIKALRDYELSWHAKLNNKGIAIESKREKPTPEQSKLYHKLELTPGGKYELTSNVNAHLEKSNIKYKSDHLLKLNGQPDIKADNALAWTPGHLDTHCIVTYGDAKYVDSLVKIDRSPGKVDGKYKIIVKDYLDSNGDLKYGGGKGNANILIDIPKVQRKIQGKGDLAVTGPSHVANLELMWNADKDPSQKLTISTNTDLTSNSVDSKNKIKVLEYNTEINLKGSRNGTPRDGEIDYELDLLLPSGRKVAIKHKRSLHVKTGGEKSNGAFDLVIAESKGSDSHTASLKVAAKDVDPRHGLYDAHGEVAYKSTTGTEFTGSLSGSHKQKGEDHHIAEGKGEVKASFLKKPITVQWNTEVKPNGVSYSTKGDATDMSFDIHGEGKFAPEERTASNVIDLKVPFESLSEIKFKSDWTLKSPAGSPCEVGAKNLANLLERMKSTKSLKLASTITKLAPNLLPSCEGKTVNELTLDGRVTKLEGIAKADLRRGAAKVNLVLPEEKPRSVQASWVQELDNEIPKIQTNVKAAWEGNKELKLDFKGEGNKELNDFKINLGTYAQLEEKHKAELNVHHKRKSEKHIDTEVEVNINDKKLKVGVDVNADKNHPRIDLKAEHSGGKSRFYAKVDRNSPMEYDSEGEVEWTSNGGGKLEWESKAGKESGDKYVASWKVNSPKLDANNVQGKFVVIIPSKQFEIDVKDAKGNIVSGSGTYTRKEEGNTVSIEGTGNVKVRDQPHAAKVNIVHKKLTFTDDQEIGTSDKWDVTLDGKNAVNVEVKDTNKHLRRYVNFCHKDKCSHYEVDSLIKVADLAEYNHELKVIYDYRSLGDPTTVSLKVSNVRKGGIVDHDAELILGGAKDVKIKTKAYIHETSAGAILTLPKRTIEAKASLDLPKAKREGSLRAEATLWLDKIRDPSLKTSATLNADVARSPDGVSISGEGRLVHPKTKEIGVKGKLALATKNTLLDASAELDVFDDTKQKINIEAKVDSIEIPTGRNITYAVGAKSKGQNLDAEVKGHLAVSTEVVSIGQWISYLDSTNRQRTAGAYAKISKNKLGAKIKLPDQVILNVQTDLKVSRDAQVVDGSIELIGLKPVGIHGEVKDFNSFTGSIYRKDEPNKQLTLKGGFAWGQVAEIRATKKNGDEKTDLAHLTVALDESHFLQTDYGGSLDSVKKIVEEGRKDSTIFVREAKIAIADSILEANKEAKALGEQLKKSQPSAKPIIAAYQNELKNIADELASEDLSKGISDLIKSITKIATEIANHLSAAAHGYREILEKFATQISQIIKKWVPKISARLSALAEAVTTGIEAIVQAGAKYCVTIIESLRKHEAEIKRIATVVGQAVQDIGRIVSKAVTQIRHEIEAFVEVVSEQLKALPISQILKERYNELKQHRVPEQTLNVLRELLETIAATLPTPELGELIQVITNYAEKRVKNEKLNDFEEIKDIATHVVAALKSIVRLLRSQLSSEDIDKIVDLTLVPIPGSAWFSLPVLSPIHLSPLKWLRSDDLPSLSEYYYTYRPTLNPLDWIPPYKAYGFLIDSHNFYTFNRKYYHFEGSCSYVLAQDYVDGNFSLIANMAGGKLKSIQLSDKQNSFEILADRSLLVNGKAHDYPALEGDLSAWRRYNNVNARSKAGIWVSCDIVRDVCQFHISGYYHGKTRGLLGTNNYEPYTDYTLPNGKVSTKSNEWANAWTVGSGCAAQSQVEHDHEKENSVPECTNLFSSSSSLSSCYHYVNPAPFRAACNHLGNEGGDQKKAACDVAFAYAQACQYDRIRLDIPHSCASCSVGGVPLAVDDSMSVKTPQKSADIILVVEQITPNEEVIKELIGPLVDTLSNDLKEKGLTDVHYSLIGYGAPDQKWPTHYGTETPSSGVAGKTKNIWYGAPSTIEQPLDTPIKKLKWAKHQLDVETGHIRLIDALNEATDYPFRPDAVKTIIGVVGQKCENSLLPISLQSIRSFLRSKSLRDQGIALHLVTPLDDLKLGSDPATNVVAIDENAVYTLADAGKKPIVGNSELVNSLRYESDPCVRGALRSSGSVISSHNLLANKGAARKQYIDVISQRVTKGLVGGETQQECKCVLSEGLYPRTTCRVTNRRQKRDLTRPNV